MKHIIGKIYDQTHWFSDEDAWNIFRLAAIVEAITWAGLIVAIVVRNYGASGGEIVVSMAGTVHGVMLLTYSVFVCITARSMEWGWKRIGGGLIAGNIPFASIVFERSMAWHRRSYPVRVRPPEGYDED